MSVKTIWKDNTKKVDEGGDDFDKSLISAGEDSVESEDKKMGNSESKNTEESQEDLKKQIGDIKANQLVFKPVVISGIKWSKSLPKKELENLISTLDNTVFEVIDIKDSLEKIKAKPPFTTSTLQQYASSRLGMSPKETMRIAQQLYEGVEITSKSGKKETVGLITYMRTDSLFLSQKAVDSVRSIIKSKYPKNLPSQPNFYKNKSKNAQEAHEAIRPSNLNLTPDSLKGQLDSKAYKLYDLIWKQTVSSQMTECLLEKRAYILKNKNSNQTENEFLATDQEVLDLGWKKIWS
jgi:DNA topoisomerase IA